MIIQKEVSGYLDADSETLLIRQTNPSPLQTAALKLTEQISTVLAQNEMVFSMRFASGGERQKKSFGGVGPTGSRASNAGKKVVDVSEW